VRLDEVVMGIDEVERVLELAPGLRNAQGFPGQAAKRLAQGQYNRKKAPIRELSDNYLRRVVAEMGEEEAWELSEQLTELGRILSGINASITVPDIPTLGIKGGTHDVQRSIYWHMLKCYWNPFVELRR
jgi:hypothetical protein